jgi:hypothetical protein
MGLMPLTTLSTNFTASGVELEPDPNAEDEVVVEPEGEPEPDAPSDAGSDEPEAEPESEE